MNSSTESGDNPMEPGQQYVPPRALAGHFLSGGGKLLFGVRRCWFVGRLCWPATVPISVASELPVELPHSFLSLGLGHGQQLPAQVGQEKHASRGAFKRSDELRVGPGPLQPAGED